MAFVDLTTVSNIESYFQGMTFDSGSSVTSTEVTRFITQGTNIIYGAIRERYEVTSTGISDSEDLTQLASLCEAFVLAKLKPILGPNLVRSIKNDNVEIVKPDNEVFIQTLKKYVDGVYSLNNTPFAGSDAVLRAFSHTQKEGIEPIAKIDVNQW